jgi:hypothetical protein
MKMRTFPYRVPRNRVLAEEWLDLDGGGPVPPALPGWDYHVEIRLSRRLQVDTALVRSDCGLPEDAALAVCIRYWPSMSRLRTLGVRRELTGAGGPTDLTLELTVPGAELAGKLVVETTLELAESFTDGRPFVAARAASVLWRDQQTVALEGGAGLLPVAPVSFAEHGLPAGAAWYVSVDPGEWERAAMGSLLVLLNTDNAQVKEALEASGEDPVAAVLWEALAVDVVADLVGLALDDDGFPAEAAGEAEGDDVTMAALVHSMVRAYLCRPVESMEDALIRLRDERRRDPSLYRAEVQRGLHFPRTVRA